MLLAFKLSKLSRLAKSIALSKCSTFRTKALFITCFMRSKMMILKLPVEET